MPQRFTCAHCGKSFLRNPRSKKQKYCSSVACQNARRNFTNKKKLKKSDQTRRLSRSRKKRWRDTYPAHEYQHEYRKVHPAYTVVNRQKQMQRNKKRKKDAPAMIVKTYTLAPQPMPDGVYMGFEVKNKKIVKTYAYMSVMQRQQRIEAHLPQKPG